MNRDAQLRKPPDEEDSSDEEDSCEAEDPSGEGSLSGEEEGVKVSLQLLEELDRPPGNDAANAVK
jgi:hypothetical protein